MLIKKMKIVTVVFWLSGSLAVLSLCLGIEYGYAIVFIPIILGVDLLRRGRNSYLIVLGLILMGFAGPVSCLYDFRKIAKENPQDVRVLKERLGKEVKKVEKKESVRKIRKAVDF